MKQSLKLKLGQQLAITPQMCQAIRLLQLSTIELRDELRQLLESNYMLKYFFSNQVSTVMGGGASSVAIRARLRKIIEGEEPGRPRSDRRLALDLERAGLRVARRTVAKYREPMGLPPSNEGRRAGAANLDVSA